MQSRRARTTGVGTSPRIDACVQQTCRRVVDFGSKASRGKTADLIFACLYALLDDSPGGNQVYIVANDEGQARDDLELAKKLIAVNPLLDQALVVRKNVIERRDGQGFIEVLPAQDAIGAHGKTYRLLVIDEIHGYRDYDLLEALSPDPTRRYAQQWITSYASIHHRPGVPLFDLMKIGREGSDAGMLFVWYAGDFTTDPEFVDLSPERRANPSWPGEEYLAQQRRRLPSHKYRRLHLNLPGLPEGSAFQADPVMAAVARSVSARLPEPHIEYWAFVDMSGGSSDDAVLAIGHVDNGRAVIDRMDNQGQPSPFDPRQAIEHRFVRILREFGIRTVTGDRYAGETFRADFDRHGIRYDVSTKSKSELYEALEPRLNGGHVVLVDQPMLEQQLLGLVWRGGRIDHPAGEHDDWANGAAGVIDLLLADEARDGRGLLEFAVQQMSGVPVLTAADANALSDEAADEIDLECGSRPRTGAECLREGGHIGIDAFGRCRRCDEQVRDPEVEAAERGW